MLIVEMVTKQRGKTAVRYGGLKCHPHVIQNRPAADTSPALSIAENNKTRGTHSQQQQNKKALIRPDNRGFFRTLGYPQGPGRDVKPDFAIGTNFVFHEAGTDSYIQVKRSTRMPMTDTMKIKRLSPSGTGYRIDFTGELESLLISEETVHRLRLVEGVVITAAQLETLQIESERFRCDRTGARLLAMRDHSVVEFRVKLRRKGYSADIAAEVTNKYLRMGALDDARYAHAAGRSLLSRRPCGRSYLVAHLQRKGIERTLAEHTADILLNDWDSHDMAVTALASRWSRFSQLELETARTRAYNYLSRRGFNYEAARAAFDHLWEQKNKEAKDQDSTG